LPGSSLNLLQELLQQLATFWPNTLFELIHYLARVSRPIKGA